MKKKNVLRKILCLFTFVFMTFGLISFAKTNVIYASQEDHDHSSWTEINELPSSSGSYVLTSDITLTGVWTVPTGETNLCLNGHVISANGGNFNDIIVSADATLNLYDCKTTSHDGYVTSDGLWHLGTGEGTLKTITGGIITGATLSGVNVSGTFNMYGGTISGCSSTDGGGVLINSSGTFNMYGGTISHNTAVNCGGGVNAQGTFNMENGIIELNIANPKTTDTYFGGGGIVIYGNGKGTLSGGKIQYNKSSVKGGGVLFLQAGSSKAQNVPLVDVSINNNTAATGGGGVFFDNSFVTVILGGNTNITGNVLNGTITKTDNGYSIDGGDKNNFDVGRGTKVELATETNLPNGMSVGLYNAATKITKATEGDEKYFSADNTNYNVKYNTENYIELKGKVIADILPEYLLADSTNKAENENGYSIAYVYSDKLYFQEKSNYSSVINDLPITTVISMDGDNYTLTHGERTITFVMSANVLSNIIVSSSRSDYLDGTYVIPHIHNFSYEANDNVITATCTEGCTEGWDLNPLTLTLISPSNFVYDGNIKNFNFADGEADAWTAAGLELPTIVYYIKQSGQTEYSLLLGTPSSVADYMAKIIVDGKEAQVQFTISKATGYIKTLPAPSDINYGEMLSNSTLFGGYVQISSTNSTEVPGLFEWTEPNTAPGLADSDVTLYNVTFTPFDENNYNILSGQVMIRVNHTHSLTKVNGQEPTETISGWKDYFECSCGALYEDADGVTSIDNLETWKAEGGNGYISTLDHDYKFVEFVWDEFTAQAKYVCSNDSTHIEYHAATITSEVTTEPTCEASGIKTYTASYDGHTDTKTETIPAIGHHYSGEVTYTWDGDKCKATWYCDREGCTNSEAETVTAVYVKDTDATRKSNEKGHYEATFESSNFAKQLTEANSVEKEDTKLAGLSGGAIAAIIIGSVLVICLVTYVSMFLYWKKKGKALKFLVSSFEWIDTKILKN